MKICLSDALRKQCIGNNDCLMDTEISAHEIMSVGCTKKAVHDGHRTQCIRNNVCLMDTELSAHETMSVGCTKKEMSV